MPTYGPHDDSYAAETVTVYGAGRYPNEETHPIPEILRKQRRRINDIAWEESN